MKLLKVSVTLSRNAFTCGEFAYEVKEKPNSYVTHTHRISKAKIMRSDSLLRNTVPGILQYFTFCLEDQYDEAIDMLKRVIFAKLTEIVNHSRDMQLSHNHGLI